MEELNKSECQICQGTGWKEVDVKGIAQVKRCECFKTKSRNKLIEQGKIPGRYRFCTFESYENHDPSQRVAKRIAEQFVKNYPDVDDAGLFFIGDCGVGKTHLSVAILQALIKTKGVPCIFFDFWDLLKSIQMSFSPDSEVSESEILSPVLNKEVVLLDDLGAHKVTDWRRDILTYIINKRYNEKRVTIITTNYLIEKPSKSNEDTLEDRIGYRLVSRLYEMCRIVEIRGKDFRSHIKQDIYRKTLR
ncbi:MAG: hypothetical protein A3C43_10945 [Candidatus Schekmanbacteria bacterium RIFCSPHIGHO2_02_FULL_38_11]|uniref:IstB-like ATP-binding domain-containing protein n=1 Tax=Candidatus Schekmanbacteria bacterium RIFCSPLOWO2_12_FULL_38_15 TaxID=1817883 RepID=A0A1F7SIF4_9BACT|nr:MAG: hypothetical protein A2043_00060 [Candidatus Schekmanbacteria bacterium GWA2_38_9]OGL49655.1 MAG: hypothetical protein A3H37_01275 [Candidatus Schekmanbacteria bacterium RIFCSPLOWO2_02_FULL_38_14]OGL50377.1 MAG: hypothetical protein A3C43_10945 [Candidatus Schekmanbacteria bacterium RIFCSPHIGHO2_02_FULL_38_11]OGL53008.1 MAG: hypothetical protein A3G31_08830 [Candidatus Schekmanbacteria bacterium RIFCSPLOWO2_12_FULL_38_15]